MTTSAEEQIRPEIAAFARRVLRVNGADPQAHADLCPEFARAITAQELIDADCLFGYLGRTSLASKPRLLWEAFTSGKLTEHLLIDALSPTWCVAETGDLPFANWRAMFNAAGYCEDGHPAVPPREYVELWRGATDDERAGHYWTTHRQFAQGYADRRCGGRLWRTIAPPYALLAHFDWSDGDEYVVDPRGLTITPAS